MKITSFIELGRPREKEMLIDTFLWFYVDKCVFRRWLLWSATLRMEQMMRVCVCWRQFYYRPLAFHMHTQAKPLL